MLQKADWVLVYTNHTSDRDFTFNYNKNAALTHYWSFQSIDEAYMTERLTSIFASRYLCSEFCCIIFIYLHSSKNWQVFWI